MEPDAVADLARWENEHWTTSDERHLAGPANVGIGAYQPLAGVSYQPAQQESPVRIDFQEAVAMGTVLAVRFRWPPDDQQRDLFLMIDYRDYPHGVVGASTWLLEYIAQNLQHDRSWFPRDLVRLSAATAIVQLARQPPGP